jgi:hypothetical protein
LDDHKETTDKNNNNNNNNNKMMLRTVFVRCFLSLQLALLFYSYSSSNTRTAVSVSSQLVVDTETETPSVSPTSSPSFLQQQQQYPNSCDNITIGEYFFILISARDPFDELAIFGFENLPPSLDLYLTDNAWNGIEFLTNEGIVRLTTPEGGIPAGQAFGYGPNDNAYRHGRDWSVDQGTFSLSQESGEQVFLFCISSLGRPRSIAAISYGGPFVDPGLANYGFNQSALPIELQDTNGIIVLPYFADRWEYTGPKSLQTEELKASILDVNNTWTGTSSSASRHLGVVGLVLSVSTLIMTTVL